MFDVTPSPSPSEASSNSSPSHSSHSESSPHASVPSPSGGSPTPDSSSSSSAPSPERFPFPTHLPMQPHLHPMKSCFHNAVPPGPHFLPRMRFIASLLASRPFPRHPPPPEGAPPRTPEVSVKGLIATPPLSITSTLSSLSPLSLSPPNSPAKYQLPSTSASLSSALSCFPSKPIRASTSLPRLSFVVPPSGLSTSSPSQSMIPLPSYKSLKKSVSEPYL